jgi:hypothetical protein
MSWIANLWFNYFWPSLKGNGPEAIVQTVVYALIAVIFVPPIRHYVTAHVKSIHEKLELHHEEVLRQAEVHHKQHMDLVKKHHAAVLATLKPEPDTKPPASKRGLRKAPHDPEHI